MKRTRILLLSVLLTASLVAGCRSSRSVVGTWSYSIPVGESGRQRSILRLTGDGSAYLRHEHDVSHAHFNAEEHLQYKIAGDRITIVAPGGDTYSCTFDARTDSLVLKTPDLEPPYIKCTRVEE
jgi:hypothetical protein